MTQPPVRALFVSFGLSLLLAAPAEANLGASILWPVMAHLIVGNLLLGLVEGSIVAAVLRDSAPRSWGWMLLGNYVSSFIGIFALKLIRAPVDAQILGDAPILHVATATNVLTIACWALSIVFELPFCVLASRGAGKPLRLAVAASLAANTVSYALLVPYYRNSSQLSLLEKTRWVADTLSPANRQTATVYYIGDDDRVYSRRLNEASPRLVDRKQIEGKDPWLFAKRETSHDWKLWVSNESYPEKKSTLVAPKLPGFVGTKEREAANGGQNYYWINEDCLDLRPKGSSSRAVRTDYFAYYGLMIKSEPDVTDRAADHLGYETPFYSWHSRCPNLLPGDQVIYELGGQILALDLPTMRLSFLWKGRTPVVALDRPPTREGKTAHTGPTATKGK